MIVICNCNLWHVVLLGCVVDRSPVSVALGVMFFGKSSGSSYSGVWGGCGACARTVGFSDKILSML